MGRTTMMSRALLVCLVGTVLFAHVDAAREKPADWDDEVDGKWEPPQEDESDSGLGGDAAPAYTPPPPPEQEQYLSQEPDAWANTFVTTRLWEVINKDDMAGLDDMIKANPRVIHARSEDGRGPLFWAYEYGRTEMVKKLEELGTDNTVRDKNGATPPE